MSAFYATIGFQDEVRIQDTMIRKAFVMSLNPGMQEEYARRHNPIWPELEEVLRDQGVCNYSIYFDETTDSLFGYAEVESEEQWAAIAQTDVCQRWWKWMREIMPSNPDNSPVSRNLTEVFRL